MTDLSPQKALKAFLAFALTFSAPAWAAGGYVYDAAGKVTIGDAYNAPHIAARKDSIPSDADVATGDKSYAILKFADGQVTAMQENTAFHVKENSYDPGDSTSGNIVFSNFSGGMRFVTGPAGQPKLHPFRIVSPNVTISVSGTELLVATRKNTVYSQIISGSIIMENKAGQAEFTAGQTVMAAAPDTLPSAIPLAALPPDIFIKLDAINSPHFDPVSVSTVLAPTTNSAPTGAAAEATSGTSSNGSVPVQAYTVANVLCDFCTSTPDKGIAHIKSPNSPDAPVTGEATLFGKHNLTPTGANTGEICAFCHTPQGAEAKVAAPRWNRTLTTLSSYRAYSSLGSAVQEATGSISMACLSCHDGSQAPNIVINTPTLRLEVGDVQVNIGNTLRSHHPVGIQYAGGGQNQNAPDMRLNPVAAFERLDNANAFAGENKFGGAFPHSTGSRFFNSRDREAFADVLPLSREGDFDSLKGGFNKSTYSGTGNGTVWWVKTPGTQKAGRQKTDLYLFTRTDTVDTIPSESREDRPYVECATCHDPHSTNPTFLRLPGGNERSQICLACHNK